MQGKADQAESDVAKLVALVEELTKGHQNQGAADDDGADDLQVLTRADLKADKAREESRAVQAKQRDAEKLVKADWDRMMQRLRPSRIMKNWCGLRPTTSWRTTKQGC
jgi:hypothetical protein